MSDLNESVLCAGTIGQYMHYTV